MLKLTATTLAFLVLAPLAAHAQEQSASSTPTTYTVKKGDYLSRISRKTLGNGRLYMVLAKENQIKNPDKIFPGQVIRIPRVTAKVRIQLPAPAAADTNISMVAPVDPPTVKIVPVIPKEFKTPSAPTYPVEQRKREKPKAVVPQAEKPLDSQPLVSGPIASSGLKKHRDVDKTSKPQRPQVGRPEDAAAYDKKHGRRIEGSPPTVEGQLLQPHSLIPVRRRGDALTAFWASFVRVLTFRKPVIHKTVRAFLTGYCHCPICTEKHPGDPGYGKTATGTNALEASGVAAASWVFDYGTIVKIPDRAGLVGGIRVVDDTGREMRRRARLGIIQFDVRFRTHMEAARYGARYADVEILDPDMD